MGFNIGDRVIIKSIKTKGEVTRISKDRNGVIYYIVDYIDRNGHKNSISTGFKGEHIELDKQYYRENKIDDILKGKVL